MSDVIFAALVVLFVAVVVAGPILVLFRRYRGQP